ncbi:uncharacterized protein MKK02DRAFT_41845 [Dioszegia hungarica]|uniref:Uncharacterized protein n=1 Tax=Dioszegia hungarica TaxID=4972 RepID=A0AA38LYD2_9TREE|nr:uncharacterized protein MKK02DRAFT_41845 [Dioszegia hungarica]KAI9638819.1 hypothetical protein MKK02DRAFT_41845 [Dioszegia hungarica]
MSGPQRVPYELPGGSTLPQHARHASATSRGSHASSQDHASRTSTTPRQRSNSPTKAPAGPSRRPLGELELGHADDVGSAKRRQALALLDDPSALGIRPSSSSLSPVRPPHTSQIDQLASSSYPRSSNPSATQRPSSSAAPSTANNPVDLTASSDAGSDNEIVEDGVGDVNDENAHHQPYSRAGSVAYPYDHDDGDESGMEVDENGELMYAEGYGVEGEEVDERGDDSQDDDEEDEDDDEDEDEDDEDDARSLDLDEDIVFVRHDRTSKSPLASLQVKSEPVDPEAGPSDPAGGAPPAPDGEVVNALIPKKKKQARKRSLSVDPDRGPPRPVDTIRLEMALTMNHDRDGTATWQTMMWDVRASAEEKGLNMLRNVYDEPALAPGPGPSGVLDGPENAPPMGLGGSILENGLIEESAEEIARRFEEKYDKGPPKKKAKKKVEVYDDTDEFIDDSELQIDAPTHMAKTVKQGFFVCEGAVEVQQEQDAPAKAKGKPRHSMPKKAPRPSAAAAAGPKPKIRKPLAQLVVEEAERAKAKGAMESPIKIDSDGDSDGEAGPSSPYIRTPSPEQEDVKDEKEEPMPVDRKIFTNASDMPEELPPWRGFPNPLRQQLLILRNESLKYAWDLKDKGKFPDHLRPFLRECGRAAFQTGMFKVAAESDPTVPNFFMALRSVLPYNGFTLTKQKLTGKMCYEDYWEFLEACEKAGLGQLRQLIKGVIGEWEKKYEDDKLEFEEAKRKWDEEHPLDGSSAPPEANGTAMAAEPSNDHADEPENAPAAAVPHGPPKEPTKNFKWTPEMQFVFAQLLDNLGDMLELNTRGKDWRVADNILKTGKEYSETLMRAALYKKIVDLFPDGYQTSSLVSREMSKIRAKKNKGTAKKEVDAPAGAKEGK